LPSAIVKGGRLVAKSEEVAIVDRRAGVRAAKQRFVQHQDVGIELAHQG
jgi:hypothetical protein